MVRALPIFVDGYEVTYDADISDVAVRCTFTWLERTASWYLDLAMPDGTVIVKGRRVSGGRTPLEGLRVLHIIGDAEIVIPIGHDPYIRTEPPAVLLVPRPTPSSASSGLTVTAVP